MEILIYTNLPLCLVYIIFQYLRSTVYWVTRTNVQVLDFIKGKWIVVANVGVDERIHKLVKDISQNESFYMLPTGEQLSTPSFIISKFDFHSSQQIVVHELPKAKTRFRRAGHTMVMVNNNEIYAIGGHIPIHEFTTHWYATDTCAGLNIHSGKVVIVAPLNERRKWCAAIAVLSIVYAFGGVNDLCTVASSECYTTTNKEEKEWKFIKDLPEPRACMQTVNNNNDTILLLGGVDSNESVQRSVFFYHISTNSYEIATWELPKEFNTNRFSAYFMEDLQQLFIITKSHCWMRSMTNILANEVWNELPSPHL